MVNNTVYSRIVDAEVQLDDNRSTAIDVLHNALMVLGEPLDRIQGISNTDLDALGQYAAAAAAYVTVYDKLTALLTENKHQDEAVMNRDLMEDYENNHDRFGRWSDDD